MIPPKGNEELIGVILAAGKGTRMAPFSQRYPKPILPICNKPLLQIQIEEMKRAGIEEIIIVIGHLGFEIARTLGNGEQFGVRVKYIDQGETLGIAHAVGKLEPFVTRPFLLFLGDIFFVTDDLAGVTSSFRRQETSAVLAVKREEDSEAIKRNFAVVVDEGSGLVRRVIEKPRYTPNKLKGCGLYLFDLAIFDAIRRTPRTAMRDEYEITDAIQILIDDGGAVRLAEVVDWDINLTTPVDVLLCNLKQLARQGTKQLVGQRSRLHQGVVLENAVVGDDVEVAHPIRITNSVILSGSRITSDGDLDHVIVTPDTFIDCRPYLSGKGK